MEDKSGDNNADRISPSEAERRNLQQLLELARAEDLGDGDLTGSLLPGNVRADAQFVPRQRMVVCGADLLGQIANGYGKRIDTKVFVHDGQVVEAGEPLAAWAGPARDILAAERVALNFLQRLSGVATTTAEYVRATAGTGAAIYDTRKTIPGWRDLAKYAVRCGGGRNHRQGLYDAVLIKDNHLAILASAGASDPIAAIAAELDRIRPKLGPEGFVELEVDTLEQLAVGLALDVDIIMLDNMPADQMAQAVAMRATSGKSERIALEASGGITLTNLTEAARTGVERIAIGAITHSAESVDIGLDISIADRGTRIAD